MSEPARSRAGAPAPDTNAGPLRAGSGTPLVERYDAALLDLDGVVYLGPAAVPHAVAALAQAREAGMRLAFVTNNASRTPATVAEHLVALGVPAEIGEVVTSAQAAVRLVAELVPAGSNVLLVGGDGLAAALRARGFRPVRSADEDPAAVVQGYHPHVDWTQLAEGAFAVRRGVPWIASNIDLTVPTPRGIAPGNGALVEVIRIATGAAPVVAGKPELALHRESTARVGAQRPLVVGDRLDTDIEGAVRAGTDSLLVLTGVTGAAELLGAPPERRPTYLAADLRGLLLTHPDADWEPASGAAALRGWTAQVRAGRLELAGTGDRVDGLRVACVARWAADGQPVDATAAVARLSSGLP